VTKLKHIVRKDKEEKDYKQKENGIINFEVTSFEIKRAS
jgi:hypothetical protein